MKPISLSPKMIRHRKFLLVLPLLVIPFLTLLFWSMGGGRERIVEEDSSTGLNLQLPDAAVDEAQEVSKMEHYKQAQSEADRIAERIRNDPHYTAMAYGEIKDDLGREEDEAFLSGSNEIDFASAVDQTTSNEERVSQKLNQLNKELNKMDVPDRDPSEQERPGQRRIPAVASEEIERLEQMMQFMNQDDGEDQEMQQLNGMLEKILDIQHPDRIAETLEHDSVKQKAEVFAVVPADHAVPISSLDRPLQGKEPSNGFYSLDDSFTANQTQNAIQAVIHETQTLVNGSTVKLRLLNDLYISGMHIPKNQFLFGIAALNGERLAVAIQGIQYENALIPVSLSVFDLDGLQGIYIPGAMGRDVAKESAGRSMQGLGLTSVDQTAGAQATSAGIEAAKNWFSRKVKRVKVTVKAGYQVLLKSDKQP